MTSSFEKPKMNPSLLSTRTTSAASPNSSDSLVVSSKPPNPAPSTRTRMPETTSGLPTPASGGHNDGPMAQGQVLAMGGGGFSSEPGNPLMDDLLLSLAGVRRPKVCFVGTATGDADS